MPISENANRSKRIQREQKGTGRSSTTTVEPLPIARRADVIERPGKAPVQILVERSDADWWRAAGSNPATSSWPRPGGRWRSVRRIEIKAAAE